MNPLQKHGQIRVLIVDGSSAARELLVCLLNADPALHVVGTASDGEEAVHAAARLRPDVIIIDIHLPRMNSYEATRQIMESYPTRILMVTASTMPLDVAASLQALEAGALTILAKPRGPGHCRHWEAADELIQSVKLMAEVPVVRRWMRARSAGAAPARNPPKPAADADIRIIAIGASTGGPLALQIILSKVPRDLAAPILIVQHISIGFCQGLIDWLHRTSGYSVRMPVHGERAAPGIAYLAPDGVHMQVCPNATIALVDAPPEHGMRPAVSPLFRSVASGFGRHAVGILLSGMGQDGAQELKSMRDAGAITLAQDKETSVVYGMPGAAVKLDAAMYVSPPDGIAATLDALMKKRKT